MTLRAQRTFSRKLARINVWLDLEARLGQVSADALFARLNVRLRQLHPSLVIPRECFDARVAGTPVGRVRT